MKKALLAGMLLCMLLSITAMLAPNAYIVASCIPPLEGSDWKIPYSYFEIGLTGAQDIRWGDFIWVEDMLVLGIRLLALICNSILAFQLVYKLLNKKSFIFIVIGLILSMLSIGTSTADGYPNSFPFITAITAICVVGLLLFHFITGKLSKHICFALLFGAFASLFSLFMSHLLTIFGIIITGIYLIAIFLFNLYARLKPQIKEC